MNGKRLVAMLIDFAIGITAASLVIFIVTLGKNTMNALTITLYFAILFLYTFFKDCNSKHASIGKRIMRIKIKYTKPLLISFLLRNLTLLIFPLEIMVIAINGYQRIGDMLANSKVVRFCE